MSGPHRPDIRIEVDWTGQQTATGTWTQPDGHPPVDLTDRVIDGYLHVGVQVRPGDTPQVTRDGRVRGRLRLTNDDQALTAAAHTGSYQTHLQSTRPFRLRAASSPAGILQLGAATIQSTDDDTATLTIASHSPILRRAETVEISVTPPASGSTLQQLLSAIAPTDLTATAVTDELIETGAVLGPLTQGKLAPISLHDALNHLADAAAGWWTENRNGHLILRSYGRYQGHTIDLTPNTWRPLRPDSRLIEKPGWVRNRATVRSSGRSTNHEIVSTSYYTRSRSSGIGGSGISWADFTSPSPSSGGNIVDFHWDHTTIDAWRLDAAQGNRIDRLVIGKPGSTRDPGTSPVRTGPQSGGRYRVDIEYYSADDTTYIEIEWGANISRDPVVGTVTLNRLPSQTLYGVHAYQTDYPGVQIVGQNRAVSDLLDWLADRPAVAHMVIPLHHETGARPTALPIGLRVQVHDLWADDTDTVIAGLRWEWRRNRIPTVTATCIPTRAVSTNAQLSGFAYSILPPGITISLTPAFAANVYAYTLTTNDVPGVAAVIVGVPADAGRFSSVATTTVHTDTPTLAVRDITCTAEDETTTQTYRVTIRSS